VAEKQCYKRTAMSYAALRRRLLSCVVIGSRISLKMPQYVSLCKEAIETQRSLHRLKSRV